MESFSSGKKLQWVKGYDPKAWRYYDPLKRTNGVYPGSDRGSVRSGRVRDFPYSSFFILNVEKITWSRKFLLHESFNRMLTQLSC